MATATLPKGEMTYEERLAKARKLEQDNRNILATPSPSAGEISPYQIGMMSKREHSQFMDNLVKKNAIEAQIKQLRLTDEELASREATRTTKEKSGRILQLQRQIEDLKAVGVGKAGKIRPSYQRTIEIAKAELNALSTNPIPAKAPEPAKPKEGTKEPWEMTRAEYGKYAKQESEDYYKRNPAKSQKTAYSETELARTNALNSHSSLVRQALEQGKPVPAEVLKDYPELGKATPSKPQAAKLTEQLDKIPGIEKTYWKPDASSLTVYYDETIDKDAANTRVQRYLADNALRDSVEKITLISTPKGTFALPTAEAPGMQVGQQAAAMGVPMKVHTQKSTGTPVTASMESYAKLQKVKAEESPKEIFGTLSHEDAQELVAGLDLRIDALEGRIDEGKATLEGIKGSVNPRVAKLTALIPATKEDKGEITHITKGQYRKVWGREPKANILTKDGKSVRWEYALDEIAQELHLEPMAQAEGKAPDEYLKGLIEEAKDTKELIRATESEVRSDESTLKALGKLKDTIKARTGKVTDGKLLEKLARAPKITITTKSKPAVRAKAMLAGIAQALIQKTQAKRPLRAIALDNALLAKTVVTVSKVEIWAKHPNRLDIRGIDTPSRSRRSKGVYADKGQSRMSRKPHRNWKRIY